MQKLFINSLPKSGTNLVSRMMELMGYKYAKLGIAATLLHGRGYTARQLLRGAMFDKNPVIVGQDLPVAINSGWLSQKVQNTSAGEYFSGHCNYTDHLHCLLKEENIKTLMVVRDPRDVLVSYAHYVAKSKQHFLHDYYKTLGHEARIDFTIEGGKAGDIYIESLFSILNSLNGWFYKEDVLIVRFEEIIGSRGGGDDVSQSTALDKIAAFLEMENMDKQHVIDNFYGESHTFRKGQIGSWTEELNDAQKEKVKEKIGFIMDYWGYVW